MYQLSPASVAWFMGLHAPGVSGRMLNEIAEILTMAIKD
ncbi:hypothetical protein C4K20_3548 [Pseudomonas chlororaphis subsp. aurantiaca]|nr:hypothetical protein C4K20_3548 [Pseudomonas chlororaphis subsp. aurantiaca]AZD67631.1 hypothetical protein C4K17_3746 [Pseudomonas chlororaphis subsp. aurantiaca]AZD73863.1 hypothetical protein C4K16_3504 [Pseudomonas chlororaphis subsp. aurantiaca]AZD80096.1 hypothetical protein C4K15_3530 [Pseudomonas chlororaphis subsp. aurantiaca]